MIRSREVKLSSTLPKNMIIYSESTPIYIAAFNGITGFAFGAEYHGFYGAMILSSHAATFGAAVSVATAQSDISLDNVYIH